MYKKINYDVVMLFIEYEIMNWFILDVFYENISICILCIIILIGLKISMSKW